jgi:anthranilate phosphoribosyltransferase
MDEISTLGPTHIAELRADGRIERYTVTPEDFGLRRARFADLASSRNVHQDALALLRVLMGKDEGPRHDIICLNAAPMLYSMGQARSLHEGMVMAGEAIANGSALEKLRAWVTWQNATPADGLPTLERMLALAS